MSSSHAGVRVWRPPTGDEEQRPAAEPLWYACYTRARHEKRVERVLEDRGIERYLPVIGQSRQWHDRRKVVEFPLFPGYIFVRIKRSEMFDVTCVPSVVTLVAVDGRPVPIAKDEIENIRRFAKALTETGELPEPQPLLEKGRRVVIVSGPFSGVEGVVEEARGWSRVVVGLAALGQGFALNLPTSHLRPIDAA